MDPILFLCLIFSIRLLGYTDICDILCVPFTIYLSLFENKKRILKFKIFKNQNFIYIITVTLFISSLFAPHLFLSLIMAFMNATCITFAIAINL